MNNLGYFAVLSLKRFKDITINSDGTVTISIRGNKTKNFKNIFGAMRYYRSELSNLRKLRKMIYDMGTYIYKFIDVIDKFSKLKKRERTKMKTSRFFNKLNSLSEKALMDNFTISRDFANILKMIKNNKISFDEAKGYCDTKITDVVKLYTKNEKSIDKVITRFNALKDTFVN